MTDIDYHDPANSRNLAFLYLSGRGGQAVGPDGHRLPLRQRRRGVRTGMRSTRAGAGSGRPPRSTPATPAMTSVSGLSQRGACVGEPRQRAARCGGTLRDAAGPAGAGMAVHRSARSRAWCGGQRWHLFTWWPTSWGWQASPSAARRLLRRRLLWRRDVRVQSCAAPCMQCSVCGQVRVAEANDRNQGAYQVVDTPSHRRCGGRAGGGGLKNRFFAAFDDAAASTRAP